MPNWCLNNLTVSHTDESMVQKFADAWNSGSVCDHYLPTPRNESLQFIEDETSPDYWYTWNINNWGTKWDFGKEEYHDPAVVKKNGNKYEVCVSPNTAWSPPIGFYNHLVDIGYNVHASYFEPGMAFCGIWDNGVDNYIEYGGVDDKRDVIPVALWNEYGMDEFFEMMEEEV